MRHSALLDAVMQGDDISGNPNGYRFVSPIMGPVDLQKENEASEIMMGRKPTASHQFKRSRLRTKDRIL